MEVTFTRTSGDSYATEVVRADGVRWSLNSAGASRWLPHELVHLVVERELALAQPSRC